MERSPGAPLRRAALTLLRAQVFRQCLFFSEVYKHSQDVGT